MISAGNGRNFSGISRSFARIYLLGRYTRVSPTFTWFVRVRCYIYLAFCRIYLPSTSEIREQIGEIASHVRSMSIDISRTFNRREWIGLGRAGQNRAGQGGGSLRSTEIRESSPKVLHLSESRNFSRDYVSRRRRRALHPAQGCRDVCSTTV